MIESRSPEKLTSTEHVSPNLSFRRRIECQGGSLPLKKRRFLTSLQCPKDSQVFKANTHMGIFQSSTIFSLAPFEKRDDKKMAALALVAAAASPSMPTKAMNAASPLSSRLSMINTKATSTISSLPSLLSVTSVKENATLTPTSATKRMQHPRLASPLPNGCYGLTSRNNSYCRRQPCYNGSTYCKLHYQQYVAAGTMRSPTAEDYSSSTSFCSLDGAPAIPNLLHQDNILHQDKRYTGTGDEVRCHATTTRGRPCAYVVVHSAKYCYLHADYDTNPPPRRGGATLRKTESGVTADRPGSREGTTSFPSNQRAFSGTPSTLDHYLSTEDNCKESNAKKLGEKADKSKPLLSWKHSTPGSSFPLLSMISTDQWFGKRVIISAGPFINRPGRVEKWGNGWVSVRIDGVGGVHNRRSFELFLHPHQSSHPVAERQHHGAPQDVSVVFRANDSSKGTTESSDAVCARQLSPGSSTEEEEQESTTQRSSMQSPASAMANDVYPTGYIIVIPHTPHSKGGVGVTRPEEEINAEGRLELEKDKNIHAAVTPQPAPQKYLVEPDLWANSVAPPRTLS